MTRGVDDLLADLAEAIDAADELVGLGKKRWDSERPLRLAGEAIIGRLGDRAIRVDVVRRLPRMIHDRVVCQPDTVLVESGPRITPPAVGPGPAADPGVRMD